MACTIIRTQSELRRRLTEARKRCAIEADEYLRQVDSVRYDLEDYRDIDRSAKAYLGYMLRNMQRGRWHYVRNAISQYVAWKWMLGHADADTFYGALGKPEGFDPRRSYIFLRDQIEGGEWDQLTKQAISEMKAR